jgi:hypothetical protein
MLIHVSVGQPFESRQDTVVALHFAYDPGVVAVLKAALRAAREEARRRGEVANVGGWLPEHRVWFVERFAWPLVRHCLLAAGHTLDREVPPDTCAPARRSQATGTPPVAVATKAAPRGPKSGPASGWPRGWRSGPGRWGCAGRTTPVR